MRFKLNGKFSWKYAIGELLLIFLGINLAIWFNNWNDRQKQTQLEIKVLSEIKKELDDDRKDFEINRVGHETAIKAGNVIQDFYLGKREISDDSTLYFMNMVYRNFTSINNTASYDYLKSVGTSIISDDSLRRRLSNLYDYKYENIKEIEEQLEPTQYYKNHRKLIWENLKPRIKFHPKSAMVTIPNSFDQSAIDTEFLYTLLEMRSYRNFTVNYYSELIEDIDQLQRHIDYHISELE